MNERYRENKRNQLRNAPVRDDDNESIFLMINTKDALL